MSVNIIGISAFFHDSACCLLRDGILVAAAEEERFSRIKADPSAPQLAFRYCLEEAGLSINDIDCVAYYEDPSKKLARQLWSGVLGNDPGVLKRVDPGLVEKQIRKVMAYEGDLRYYDHHESHGASAFYYSGFEDAAILTVDGVGEWATTTYGTGSGNKMKIFEEVQFPDSLGLLYSTITSYLGFGVNDGEYKVMGLAPYGKPIYINEIRELVQPEARGQYTLNMKYFDFLRGKKMFSESLVSLLGQPSRKENEPMQQFHKDLSKSLQVVLEEILLAKARYLHEVTGMENLCMAGGVALNCVANGRILREGPFKRLYVQPAANDAGCALGAAALAWMEISGQSAKPEPLRQVYLGPSYSSSDIHKLLQAVALNYHDCRREVKKLLTETAKLLADGKVIGWFQGRMEFGPRSLGARSILADPKNPGMRDRINAMVKKREGFRPFAPAVIDAKAKEHFDLDHDSPFMLETCQVISHLSLPAITHIDGSARVQTVHKETNPRFYHLLMEFEKLTQCPILLNTSFNIKGEPIVCTPEDALRCFVTTDIDALILGDFIIKREDNDMGLLKMLIQNDNALNESISEAGIVRQLYTFV